MLLTAPATLVTFDEVCSAADEIAPTLALSSSVAEEIDENRKNMFRGFASEF